MIDGNFHNQLKFFFKAKNITQQQIADTFGVSQTYINSLLCGKRNFGRKTAKEWQDAFGLNMVWLMTGDGEMTVDQKSTSGNNIAVHGDTTTTTSNTNNSELLATLIETNRQLIETNRQLTEQNQKLISYVLSSGNPLP